VFFLDFTYGVAETATKMQMLRDETAPGQVDLMPKMRLIFGCYGHRKLLKEL
jgi:hypothetical protein